MHGLQKWQQSTVKAAGTPLEAVLDHRDLMEVVKQQFAALGPEHALRATELKDANGKRVYYRLNHGNWWLQAQKHLPPDAVIIPIILYSDKTQCDDRKTVIERCVIVLVNPCRLHFKPASTPVGWPSDGIVSEWYMNHPVA